MYASVPRNGSTSSSDSKGYLGYSPTNKQRLPSRPPTPLNASETYSFSTSLRRDEQSPTKHHIPHYPPPHHQHHRSQHHSYAHTQKATTPSARFSVLPADEALRQLSTSAERGLDSSVVQAIRQLSGANEFHVGSKESAWSKFGKQFYESPLILLLLASAVISAVFGNYDDALSIALAIFIVVSVGFVQERRSEKSLEALNKLVPHYCHLIRCGQRRFARKAPFLTVRAETGNDAPSSPTSSYRATSSTSASAIEYRPISASSPLTTSKLIKAPSPARPNPLAKPLRPSMAWLDTIQTLASGPIRPSWVRWCETEEGAALWWRRVTRPNLASSLR